MNLPPFVTANNIGMIGISCVCDVDGVTRKAALLRFSALLYEDLDKKKLSTIIEGNLRSALKTPQLRLIDFTALQLQDTE